jgi:HIV Tat-specific factor 1
MVGRFFSGTRVEAYIADGTEKFKKTNEKKVSVEDDDVEEDKRLDKFGNWLEEDEDA